MRINFESSMIPQSNFSSEIPNFSRNSTNFNESITQKKQMTSKQEQQIAKDFPYSHLIFDQEQFDKNKYEIHLLLTYRGLVYSSQYLAGPSHDYLARKSIILPERINKSINKTLFFDLDETLICACEINKNAQYYCKINNQEKEYIMGINIRPYAQEMLKILSQYYEIYVFTASSEIYAQAIIELLDPKAEIISGCLSRKHCLETMNGLYIKDLRIIQNRSLSNMLIVDNCIHSFAFQIENGIPILGWKDNFLDRELAFLAKYLLEAANAEDVRDFNRERLQLMKLVAFTYN